tara:strand:+ start:912 stop:1154 length:243 start_codon:yes stop_codon:yes gene_type:complete
MATGDGVDPRAAALRELEWVIAMPWIAVVVRTERHTADVRVALEEQLLCTRLVCARLQSLDVVPDEAGGRALLGRRVQAE